MAADGVWGRVAHVFVAAALALPIVVVVTVLWISLTQPGLSVLSGAALTALGCAFFVVVVWVALLPPVRQVEVSTARILLGVDLPDVTAPTAWPSRRRGAAWLAVLASIGVTVVIGLLYLLPMGVGLVLHPFSGADHVALPGRGPVVRTGTGWSATWTAVAGILLLVVAVWGVAAAGGLRARIAGPVLGPGLTERVALAAARERDLARANDLAREVHDSVGHTLTAMTLQISAARALAASDPEASDRALALAEELGRRAQADVDGVVGALRRRDGGPGTRWQQGPAAEDPSAQHPAVDVVPSLRRLLAETALPVEARLPERLDLDTDVAHTVVRSASEGLTNAARHGSGIADLAVTVVAPDVVVEVRNPVPGRPMSGPHGRSGLVGLRERLALAGGTLEAGPADSADAGQGVGHADDSAPPTWVLRATIPMRRAS